MVHRHLARMPYTVFPLPYGPPMNLGHMEESRMLMKGVAYPLICTLGFGLALVSLNLGHAATTQGAVAGIGAIIMAFVCPRLGVAKRTPWLCRLLVLSAVLLLIAVVVPVASANDVSALRGVSALLALIVAQDLLSRMIPRRAVVVAGMSVALSLLSGAVQAPAWFACAAGGSSIVVLAIGVALSSSLHDEETPETLERHARADFIVLSSCIAAIGFAAGAFQGVIGELNLMTGLQSWLGQALLAAGVLLPLVYACWIGVPQRGEFIVIAASVAILGAFALGSTGHEGLRIGGVLCTVGAAIAALGIWTHVTLEVRADRPAELPLMALALTATAVMPRMGMAVGEMFVTTAKASYALHLMGAAAGVVCALCCAGMLLWSRHSADIEVCETVETEAGIRPLASTADELPVDNPSSFASHYALSAREQQVLTAVLAGYTLAAAAEELGLSSNTTRTYMRRICIKTGVDNRQQLVSLVREFNGRAVSN